jgi:hypothetical protein
MKQASPEKADAVYRLRRMQRTLARALRAPTKAEIRTAKALAIKAVQQTKER